MSVNTITKSYILDGSDAGLELDFVDDYRFKRCASLTNDEQVSFGSLAKNNISNDEFTATIWVKRATTDSSFNFLECAGFSCDSLGKMSLLWQSLGNDAVLSFGVWYHLAFVKTADKASFYINGRKVGKSLTLPSQWLAEKTYVGGDSALLTGEAYQAQWWTKGDSPANPESVDYYPWEVSYDAYLKQWLNKRGGDFTAVSYQGKGGDIRLALQSFYSEALTEDGVYRDFYANLPSVIETSSDVYPLDINIFSSAYGDTLNKLYISSDLKVDSEINVTNINHDAIEFSAAGEDDVASANNYHFLVRFRNGSLEMSDQPPCFSVRSTTSVWDISPMTQDNDGQWSTYFLCLSTLRLEPAATLSFQFDYGSADGSLGARSTHLSFYYHGMKFSSGGDLSGDRVKQIDIVNLSNNNSYVKAVNEKIVDTDKAIDTLEEQLLNQIKSLREYNAIDVSVGTPEEIEEKKNKKIGYVRKDKSTEEISDFMEAISLLVQHSINLDDKIDDVNLIANSAHSKIATYGLSAVVEAPTGIVCNESGNLSILLYNNSGENIELFKVSGAPAGEGLPPLEKIDYCQIQIKMPIGDGEEHLSTATSSLGGVGTVKIDSKVDDRGKFERTADSSIFTWTATKEVTLPANSFIEFSITGVIPNPSAGRCFIPITLSNVNGKNNTEIFVGVTKRAGDLANLVGGGGVAIGKDKSDDGIKLDVVGAIASDRITAKGNIKSQSLKVEDRISDRFGKVLSVPIGGIIMWANIYLLGETDIPPGFGVCDGSPVTLDTGELYWIPDLRDRFVVGAGRPSKPGQYIEHESGGQATVLLKEKHMPVHTHPYHDWFYDDETQEGNTAHQTNRGDQVGSRLEDKNSQTKKKTSAAGGSVPHDNIPPYYALIFIQRYK